MTALNTLSNTSASHLLQVGSSSSYNRISSTKLKKLNPEHLITKIRRVFLGVGDLEMGVVGDEDDFLT